VSHPEIQGSPASVSIYDARPFFEKALHYGVQHGIIDPQKLEQICIDAPKGMVQIARYFGSEFLRPEIEKARERMVNLVSIYLEASCQGDLRQAAESLRDHSFLSRSKGGSDMLKALIAMPQNSHFGMNEYCAFTDEHIPLLAKWSLRSLADYQTEFRQRSQVALVMDAAIWLAAQLGMDAADLEEAGKDAEAVIRTALLVLATARTDMPDWVSFEKMIAALRKKHGAGAVADKVKSKPAGKAGIKGAVLGFSIVLPKNIPAQLADVVEAVRESVVADLPKILDPALAPRQLFDQTPAFMGRYFWVEDGLSEVDHHDRLTSNAWAKATGGLSDDGSLLTLFLCIAAGAPPKTLLTEKAAMALVRKIQKSGLNVELAHQYIAEHAPVQYQHDYAKLWAAFAEESQSTLTSDSFSALEDALALLRLECNVR
jgi:hypothetical protein